MTAGASPMDIKRGIDKAGAKVEMCIRDRGKDMIFYLTNNKNEQKI